MDPLKMKRYSKGILLLFMLITLLPESPASARPDNPYVPHHAPASEDPKRVLVLNSFHEGYHWTDRIMQGVKSVFDEKENVELVITYMDAKRCSDKEYLELLHQKFAYKYRFATFDAIISTDDPALNFLLEHREELFPRVPVIFCGLNDFTPSRIKGHDDITGVYENYGVGETINLMLKLHPGARKITVISDATLAGRDLRHHVAEEAPYFSSRVDIDYLDNLSLQELIARLGDLPKESLVLWAMYLRTPEGSYISSEESLRIVTEASGLPTYCIWDVVGQGVVGGKVTSPHYQGRTAAEMAAKVLRGDRVQDLDISGSPLAYIFDFNALKRHNIKHSALPPSSTIINQPFCLYEKLKIALWVVLLFATLLMAVIASLIFTLQKNRKAEAAVQESEERFRLMSLRTGQMIYDYDIPSGQITWAGAIEEITGYTPEEFKDINHDQWKAMIHDDDRERILGLTAHAMAKGASSTSGEYLFRRKDESFTCVKANGAFLKDKHGRSCRMLGSIKDITDLKQAQQERRNLQKQLIHLQKMESIGHLAGGIAHDFRNILVPIIGMAELLLQDLPAGSLQHNNAREILNAGTRGSDLVKQILAFSRETDHEMKPLQMQEILREVLKLGRSTIPASIEITEDIQASCSPVSADPTQIHQVALNLITNAYHAVELTSGKIHVQLKEISWDASGLSDNALEPGRYALLSISDTGCGIPPECLNKIFDPYFTTKSKNGKGSGLGLSVVHGIVKNHKGDIKVYSDTGKGTTFHIYLPIAKKPVQTDFRGNLKTIPIGDEHILVIDDDDIIVEVVTQVLERLGYRVTACTSNIGVVEAFQINPSGFDLVLTDLNMPNMTGVQLARELMAIRPNIPIIIWSGTNETINEEEATYAGVKRLLTKPVGMPDLANTVREVLDEA
ncbi:hypothetical protein DSLASN_06310 [Desulfoluna limicola]|uniref:histidine kinase n=2 Tax=Desulfoluna limicola TaxID=2810562 RepID=A0ABN6EXD0_9BACT|nr:hypothetical protein DSLASN_06310 [Desulfoluna limicola]